MLDIGFGELLVIAVLALLVFGPDRLPKAAAEAARTLRQIRTAAVAARRDLVDAAGLEGDDELRQAVRDIRDLDPRRVLTGLDDEPRTARGRGSRAVGGTAGAATGASRAPGAGPPAGTPGQPAAGPTAAAAAEPTADPDWT